MSRNGEVLGGLFFGHPTPGVFTESSEGVLTSLASQAAIAIDNTNLTAALERELVAVRVAEVDSRRLAAIVTSSEDAIVSKNLDGIITSWNESAQRIFGYTSEEVVGQPVTMLIPTDHLDEEPAIIKRLRRGNRIDHYQTVRKRKDGSLVDISLSVSPIRDSDGNVVGASKIIRDISDQKQSERALKEAMAALAEARDELESRVHQRTASLSEAVAQMEEFSYTVSHDLRAPVRAMRMYSGALLEDYGDLLAPEPDAVHHAQRIRDNCVRLDKMISDILTFGQASRGEIKLERVSLDELVAGVVSHHPSLQPPRAEIKIDPLGDVVGHEPSLIQIVSNLLTNAAKFVAAGVMPCIHVWAAKDENRVRLWIEDNGIGIEPQYQHRLFGMFERLHPDQTYEGTGVGLAIVRKAAERMGGTAGVESDGIHGSRFWVDLARPTYKQ